MAAPRVREGASLVGHNLLPILAKVKAHVGACPQPMLVVAGKKAEDLSDLELATFVEAVTGK